MNVIRQFLLTGFIRLLRSKTDCLLLVLWPFLIVIVIRSAALPWRSFPLVLLMASGMQAAVAVGYDYGRARETGSIYKLLTTGVSPVLLFAGINGSRILAFFVSGALSILLAALFGIEVHGAILVFTLFGAMIVYTSLGLVIYRCMRSALGVLSATPIVLLIFSLPSFSESRHWPEAIAFVSPVSTLASLGVAPSLPGAAIALGWIACSVFCIGALVIRRK